MKTSLLAAALILSPVALHLRGDTPVENKVPPPPNLGKKHQRINAIPPRYQWEHNGGYCGETSMISAGLYYGQYLSQFDVRTIASGLPQNKKDKDGNYTAQLLLGSNDDKAAKKLRLAHERFDTDNSRDLLGWIKSHVLRGRPVIMGVFNNEYRLYGTKDPTKGDDEYDHIVPVLGWASDHPLDDDELHDDDVILISDNGLYTPASPGTPPVPNKLVPYYFHYAVSSFLKSREQANLPKGSMYSLLDLPKYQSSADKQNYGIAILGVTDESGDTLPVRLTTSANYEAPPIGSDSNKRPAAMTIRLTIQVSGLDASKTYNLYHYTAERDVPTGNFNDGRRPWRVITGTSGTWTGTMIISTEQKAFFRAVEATDDAPAPAPVSGPKPGEPASPSDASSLF